MGTTRHGHGRTLVADDIVFDCPTVQTSGAQAFLEAVGGFAEIVTDVEIVASLGDDDQAMIHIEMTTKPFGKLRSVEHLRIRDGKIYADILIFDSYEVRGATT